MALILVPLALGRDTGWPTWVWICLVAAAVTGPAVLGWQGAIARRGGTPIIDTRLFKNHAYALLLSACSLFQLYFGCFMFTLSLLLQVGLGESADQASVVFVCQGLLYTATSLRGGRLVARYGRRVPLIGAGVAVLGLGLFAAELTSGDPGMLALIAALGVIGAGNGLVSPPLLGAALSMVPAERAGAASGALNTAQQFCNSLGVAVIGTVFFAVAGDGVSDAETAMQVVSAIYAGLLFVIVALAWRGWPRPAISPARAVAART
jgi:MFS family permease